MSDITHIMLRNADVSVTEVANEKGSHARILVNGEYEHTFDSKSRVSRHLDLMSTQDLAERLTGGQYFFVEGQLVDYRDAAYGDSFVHDDAALDNLMSVLGYRDVSGLRKTAHRLTNRTQSRDLSLSKIWDQTEIQVPHYKAGGDFTSELSFVWNPFQRNIDTKFELIRQICTNGMVGLTPIINMKIPLINRWEEHLNIAHMQLQHKIEDLMTRRLSQMVEHRCTVADTLLLEKHIATRMLDDTIPAATHQRLRRMYDVVDPYEHLAASYKPEVFENRAMAAQVPAHLSVFDIWNIATEVCQHSDPLPNSSDAALQKLANALVFDRDCATNRVAHIGKNIELSPFSDPTRAFFGDVEVD